MTVAPAASTVTREAPPVYVRSSVGTLTEDRRGRAHASPALRAAGRGPQRSDRDARVRPTVAGMRLRSGLNAVNGSTALGLLVARAGGAVARSGPAGLVVAHGYRRRLPLGFAFTVGDVVIHRGGPGWLEGQATAAGPRGAPRRPVGPLRRPAHAGAVRRRGGVVLGPRRRLVDPQAPSSAAPASPTAATHSGPAREVDHGPMVNTCLPRQACRGKAPVDHGTMVNLLGPGGGRGRRRGW